MHKLYRILRMKITKVQLGRMVWKVHMVVWMEEKVKSHSWKGCYGMSWRLFTDSLRYCSGH